MPDMTPQGIETTLTREELLQARDEDARRIRMRDPKGRKQAVTARCMECKIIRGPVVVDRAAWEMYVCERGKLLVQEAFPTLSTNEREVLRGGRTNVYLCPKCFRSTEGEEE
jgi:hypothetical protein